MAQGSLFPSRATKTPEELEHITESQQAAVAAMNAAVELIATARIGADRILRIKRRVLTSEMVRGVINRVLLDRRCIGKETIVAGGPQAADPHCKGEGPLRAGETIVLDIFPQHLDHGYWGDLTRTVVRGAPGAPLKKMYAAVRAAQATALRHIKAGAPIARIHGGVMKELERRGFKTDMTGDPPKGFIHGTGHGVGLEIHEPPGIYSAPGRLRSGNVVTVEPGLYYPGIGGIRIEDTIVVTPAGWRHLATCPKVFEV